MDHPQAYPENNGWLWSCAVLGNAFLTRREAALVDVLRRSTTGPMTIAMLKAEVDALTPDKGKARLPFLKQPGSSPLPAFHEVMTTLCENGLVVASDDLVRGRGRTARAFALTDAGRAAAVLVDVQARRLLDEKVDPSGRARRTGHEVLEAILRTGAVHGHMASDREGFRVEAVLDGRRLPVLEGTAERHAAVQSDLKERNEGTTSVKGHYVTDHFRFHGHRGFTSCCGGLYLA